MPLSLVKKGIESSIPVLDLRDGQIARITSWTYTSYIGQIVIRNQDDLIAIGPNGDRWTNLFNTLKDPVQQNICRVKILPNGTLLKVEDNE